jgi:hypothetical protein
MPTLINCPACRREVSTGAAACPQCGHQFAPVAGGISARDPVHIVGILLVVLMAVGIVFWIVSAS